MIYCRIEAGVVVDRAEFDGAMPEDWPDRPAWIADDEAQIGWTWDGDHFSAPAAPEPSPPTVTDVVTDRERRLSLGFDHDFGDERGVHRIGTTEADQKGWSEVTTIAMARQVMSVATPILIVTDTGPVEVTPAEWLAVLEAAAAFRQPLWAASFVLQAMDPIPADFADDAYWPSA